MYLIFHHRIKTTLLLIIIIKKRKKTERKSLISSNRQRVFRQHHKHNPQKEKNKLDFVETKTFDLQNTMWRGWQDKV